MKKRSKATQRPQRLIDSRKGGFTLIELMVVIVIAGIIMLVAIPKFQGTRATRVARNARDVFVWNAQRARARAIQTGQTYLYELNPATERAWIVKRGATVASDTFLTINFQTQYEATVSTSANTTITVCYNPKGYANTSCTAGSGTVPTANVDITFTHANYTSVARLKPLGQVTRQ